MKVSYREILQEIMNQWGYRAIGNTHAMLEGALHTDCLVVAMNEQPRRDFEKQGISRKNIVTLDTLSWALKGCRKPLLVDHYVMQLVITKATEEIINEYHQPLLSDELQRP